MSRRIFFEIEPREADSMGHDQIKKGNTIIIPRTDGTRVLIDTAHQPNKVYKCTGYVVEEAWNV